MASGKRRFGVRFVPDRGRRAPYGRALCGEAGNVGHRGRKDGEKSKRAGKAVVRAETEGGGVRGRIRRAGEKNAGEIRADSRERSVQGRQTYLLARVLPAPQGEAAAVESLPEAKAPPSAPLFPIRARSCRRRVAVSRPASSGHSPSARGAAAGGLLFPCHLSGPPSPPPVFPRAGHRAASSSVASSRTQSRLLQSSLEQDTVCCWMHIWDYRLQRRRQHQVEEDSQDEGPRGDGGHFAEAT
ncbi:hypothetical protein SORBI_3001G259850 [Sorghum bicolor]|uniref:Uncharacterized protein n=1 Tax=Sorghum bicolor TaxID=4558 RepID=A0A1Z5S7G9_SORBI|nr:hypothetical protein SORBI_3001G259850 [Sorghum bicolor]